MRLATVLPFAAGIFLGTLITLFLVLTLRSIDGEEEARFGEDGATGVVVMPSVPRATRPQKNLDASSHDTGSGVWELVSYSVVVRRSELRTRGLAAHKTWASDLGRRASYYLFPPGEDADIDFAYKRRMPLITLGGSKPRSSTKSQSASHGVIQALLDVCQRGLGKYQWYAKIEDTTYVRHKQLERILVTLNSSEPHLVGHGIFPEGREREELGLREGEGYCLEMGYVMSVRAMQLVCPMLDYCRENARSDNEDVEVARCVRLATGVNCTSSLEVLITPSLIARYNYTEAQKSMLTSFCLRISLS